MRQIFLPPVVFFVTAALMVKLDWFAPIAQLWQSPFTWPGLLLFGLGMAITFRHAALFKQRRTEINTFRPPSTLVTDGMFRYSRNPMYLGFVLALLGLAIYLGSTVAFIPVAAFKILTALWYIPFEERAMSQKFGAEYADYCKKVRRWI